MKNLILALLLSCCLVSCSKDAAMHELETDAATDTYPQKWELVSMSGSMAGVPPQTGTNMAWQEYYVFKADGSFTKTREREGATTQAHGNYTLENTSEGKQLRLTYTTGNTSILGTCLPNQQEALTIKADNRLYNSWNICDGPGLIYKKANFTEQGN